MIWLVFGATRIRIRIVWNGSGSGQMIQIHTDPDPDPDPQHWKFYNFFMKSDSALGILRGKQLGQHLSSKVQLAWLSEVSQAWPEMQTCLMTLINPSTWYLTLDICGAIEPSSEVGTARWVGKGRELPRIPDLMTANKPTRKPTKLILMHCSHLQTGIGYPWHNE